MSEVRIAHTPFADALEASRFPVGSFVPEDSSFSLSTLESQHQPLDQPRHQPSLGHSLVSAGSSVCRICHTNTVREPLISPCNFDNDLPIAIRFRLTRISLLTLQSQTTTKPDKYVIEVACNQASDVAHPQKRSVHMAEISNEAAVAGVHFKRCKGSLAFVHLSCLERWLNQSCRSYCELCRYRFNAVETPRYKWSEALRIWVSHPRNRRHIQSDLLVFTLLTVVTLGLVAVCLLGIRYFVIEGKKIGISRIWTRGAVAFFLTIVVLGYLTTVYLLIKDQIAPWYRWWKNTVNVRLVMDNEEPRRVPSSLETLPDRDNQTTPSSRTPEEKVGDSDETGI